MTLEEQKAREESYRKLQEMAKRHSTPRGGFRSIGDELSGHEGAMLAFGLQQGKKQDAGATDAPKAR